MVTAMVNAERAPKTSQLEKLEAKTTTQLTSLGQLKGAISTFQSALVALNSPSSFLARTATTSDSKVLSGTAGQSAAAGNYKIEVSQLANSSKVALAAMPSEAKLASGTLSIKVGDTALADIVVDSSNNTLAGLRDAINKAGASEGISATVVTDDFGSRLVLTSSKMGDGQDITVAAQQSSIESGQTALTTLAYSGPTEAPDPAALGGETSTAYLEAKRAYDAGGQTLATAKSAKFTVDGLSVTRDSNSVSDVVEGLTLDLKTVGSSTLTVAKDEAGVTANVKKFVEAYNTLMNYVNTETKVTTVGESDAPVAGALVGDSTVRSLVSTIRNELVSPQGDGAIRALADLGVTTQRDGTLSLDSAKLNDAVKSDFSGVAAYFTGDNGLAMRLGEKLKPYTDDGGILESRTDALAGTIEKIDKQREDLTRRITALEERLYKQFNAMDSLVGQLTSTSDQLTQLFDSMPGFVSQK